jgi:arabinogalactan endo-1,4-beta-galactosidase
LSSIDIKDLVLVSVGATTGTNVFYTNSTFKISTDTYTNTSFKTAETNVDGWKTHSLVVDQALNVIYEALELKVFKSLKDLECWPLVLECFDLLEGEDARE